MKDRIAKELLIARLASGLTQKQLAEASGFTEAAISHYENARREPTVASLRKLSDALGVSIDSLTGGKGPTNEDLADARQHVKLAAKALRVRK